MKDSQLPALTREQLDVLRRFASFEARLPEVRAAFAGIFDLSLEPLQKTAEGGLQRRTASVRFRLPEPGIVIGREHIANALERRRFDLISERDLVEWASVLLMNDAYVLDPADEDLIAEWLNDISVHLNAS